MYVPVWAIVLVCIAFAVVIIWAIAMHAVARGASKVIDGVTNAFLRR